ncbi:MAG: response regulator transcription factor [Thermoleophilia bacterium]|nr:response regulator transcription factor [Thermoleophilia bacterium]
MEPRRVVICDDHEIVREALKARISHAPGLEVAGEAVDGAEVVGLTLRLKPDLLIIDVEMPKANGISAIEAILAEEPKIRILIFTAHRHPNVIDLAARTGASGYLPKSASASEIETAAEAVLSGGTYFPEKRRSDSDDSDELERLQLLSPRERQILDLLAGGMRAQGVAAEIGIQTATVYTHVRNVVLKLEVDTRTQAVAIATKYSFLNPVPDPPPV